MITPYVALITEPLSYLSVCYQLITISQYINLTLPYIWHQKRHSFSKIQLIQRILSYVLEILQPSFQIFTDVLLRVRIYNSNCTVFIYHWIVRCTKFY